MVSTTYLYISWCCEYTQTFSTSNRVVRKKAEPDPGEKWEVKKSTFGGERTPFVRDPLQLLCVYIRSLAAKSLLWPLVLLCVPLRLAVMGYVCGFLRCRECWQGTEPILALSYSSREKKEIIPNVADPCSPTMVMRVAISAWSPTRQGP